MLNLFFPFLTSVAQPKPDAETSPARDEYQASDATPERSDALASPAPPTKAQASSQARQRAGQAASKKAAAVKRQKKRPLKEAEPRSAGEAPVSKRPKVVEAPQLPVRAEATEPAPKRVERGGRTGKWSTNAHRRSTSAAPLPAGQRWKRRLPRAIW